jgi:hypothetical protein
MTLHNKLYTGATSHVAARQSKTENHKVGNRQPNAKSWYVSNRQQGIMTGPTRMGNIGGPADIDNKTSLVNLQCIGGQH